MRGCLIVQMVTQQVNSDLDLISFFFFSSRRRHTRSLCDWSSDVCSSDLTTPLQWLGAGPVTTYNVLYLVSFPFSALAAHALAYTLTGRHDAGFVSGLV